LSDVLPTALDVEEARGRLKDWLIATPTLVSEHLNERVGCGVLVKAECVQHAGSFKIRGALNRILQLRHAERSAGLVAYSSGNHAQSVALAARWLDTHATIVMPDDAPTIKTANTRAWGAEIVTYDRRREDREEIASRIAQAQGSAIVPPFDHPHVIAGQGTVGLELALAAKARRLDLAAVYVPCGGGGLIAGCALALEQEFPACKVVAIEPERYDDTARSLAKGERQVVERHAPTICDGLMAPTPGAITFAVNRTHVAQALAVGDAEVRRAMAFAARHLKVVVEPSGAVALAAVMNGLDGMGEKWIGVVLSGGNVDPELLASVLAEYPDP
jgi:threonine dehydratase